MKTALQVKMQQHRSVNPVGNILLYFYVILSLCLGTTLFIVNVSIGDADIVKFLDVFIIAMFLLIAMMQVVVQFSINSKIWSPLQQIISDFRSEHKKLVCLNLNNLDQMNTNNKLIASLSLDAKENYPNEFKELQTMFNYQINLLKDFSKQAQSESALMVMGQVCAHVAHDMRTYNGRQKLDH